MNHSISRTRKSGFTIIELAIAASMVAVLGLGLASATLMGNNAHVAVTDAVNSSKGMRAASSAITHEFKCTDADTMTITTLADGNHELRLMQPITLAGVNTWGVYDRTMGPDEADQNKEDWQICYTVQGLTVNGVWGRYLVRQILDEAGVVQDEDRIVAGLREGGASSGFSVTQTGDMWQIEINTVGYTDDSQGEHAEFHVRTRN